MFYWMKRSTASSDTLSGLGHMSKVEILRDIVIDKLTTAAQEILAIVERTVAGYEEEASGMRQEIDRQRRQLELLQPQVKLERTAMIPDVGSHDVVVLTEEEEEDEEEPHKQQQCDSSPQFTDVQDASSLGLVWFGDEEEDYDEEQLSVPSATGAKQRREDQKDPDYQMPSRSVPSGGLLNRRKPGRPRISEPQNHLDLRIRILEDSHADVLSKRVFQMCPLQELQCPRGLQEPDFLNLLRSTFPQLAADQPFDVFTSDRTRRLKPLAVMTLTPEEIDSSIRASGYSALYIRLKTGREVSDSTSRTETLASPSSVLSERRRRGRPRLGEEPTHHLLRVCMLEETEEEVFSTPAFQRGPVQELRCPRGLQEADFLDLLKSAFPQLAEHNKRVNVFKLDHSRRLQRLRIKALTPQEIYRAMKSRGTEKTVLYIRFKTEDEETHLPPRNEDVVSKSPSEDTQLCSRGCGPRPGEPEDAEDRAAQSGAQSYDGDGSGPDPKLQSSKLQRRRTWSADKSKMPCKVCGVWYRLRGSLIKHSWKHVDEPQGVCGVCGGIFQSADELRRHLKTYQKTHNCSFCGKSFLTVNGLKCHVTLHTGNRPFQCDACHKSFAHMSSLSVHRWVHAADKPHKCDTCQKAFGLKAQLRAHSKVHTVRDKCHCNVCGKSFYDMRSLTRHKVTHSGERRYGCEVCGKRFKLPDTLKSHEKIHTSRERPYLCDICCKTFLSNCGLAAHMRTHSTERAFTCVTCSKGFISNGELKAHLRVHSGEAPYGCSECGRFFKRKTHLTNHIRAHLGIKLFVCVVCGKACSRQEHLTVHMRTHNGERPYKCSLCDKAFTQSHCLKTHMKVH